MRVLIDSFLYEGEVVLRSSLNTEQNIRHKYLECLVRLPTAPSKVLAPLRSAKEATKETQASVCSSKGRAFSTREELANSSVKILFS